MNESKPEASSRRSDPKALSSEYHRAHKQLLLWSAILFIWELIGVDLDKAKEVGGNVGALIAAIKSPQAIPWVLLILVIYFLIKCSLEWAQCSVARRKVVFARADFMFGWVISIASVTLYVGQTLSRIQFADRLQEPHKLRSFLSALIGSLAFIFITTMAMYWYYDRDKSARNLGLVALALFILIIFGTILNYRSINWTFMMVGLAVGFLLGVSVFGLLSWRDIVEYRSRRAHK